MASCSQALDRRKAARLLKRTPMSSLSPVAAAYQSGDLAGAIRLGLDAVKSKPTDLETRGLLVELFCFAGEWERADKQLDTIGHQDPQSIVGLSLLRQLIRAEVSRAECFAKGRAPDVLFEPDGVIKLQLEALAASRAGDDASAAALLGQAEVERPRVSGTCDGEPFGDFRDLDDYCLGVFEVLTSTGKYYWTPIEKVRSIVFEPTKRPRDILWRRATMDVIDGPQGEVYLPSVYPWTDGSDDALRLSRATDWIGEERKPTRGVGQRMFLVGDEAKSIMQVHKLDFMAI